jgi:hypothetical protein
MECDMSMVLIEVKNGVVQSVTSDDPWLKCGVVDYDVQEDNGPFIAEFNHGTARLSEEEVESTHALDNPGHDRAEDRIDSFGAGEELFYVKRDGSVPGFEVVTHPCTLRYHQEVFPWPELCKYMNTHHCKSHDTSTCGLHIHVGKAGYGADNVMKCVLFVNRQKKRFELLARRQGNHFCGYREFPNMGDAGYTTKYSAVNTSPRSTFEFRIFKGTLKPETILASVELVHAVTEFVKGQMASHLNESSLVFMDVIWKAFLHHICDNPETYPNLIPYLVVRAGRDQTHCNLLPGGIDVYYHREGEGACHPEPEGVGALLQEA